MIESPTEGLLLKAPPPQNLEAEQSVLGAMLIERDAIIRAGAVLKGEDFYRDAHRAIFEAVVSMQERGDAVDLITLSDVLRAAGSLDEIGGVAYLTTLASFVPSTDNVEHYANIVRDRSTRRRLLVEAQRIISRATEGSEPATRLVGDAADRLLQLATSTAPTKRERHIRDVLPGRMDAYEEATKHHGLTGWPTGLSTLDQATGGLQPTDLILDAGRPSTGKTTLAMQFARDGAKATGKTAIVFSIEMAAEQLADRLVASAAGIDPASLRNGRIGDQHWHQLSQAMGQVAQVPLLIDDTAEHSTSTLWATARRVSLTIPIGLIVIDYLQLLTDRGDDDDNKRLSYITRRLKAMAKDLNVPVLCLSQLSRANEKGFGKPRPPRLSDLRGSGAIEQDADVVMFLHYDEDDAKLGKRPTQLIVAKQRNGPVGDFELVFDRARQRFYESDTRHTESSTTREPVRRMGEYDDDEEGAHGQDHPR